MRNKHHLILLLLLCSTNLYSQNTYLRNNSYQSDKLSRLEIKLGIASPGDASSIHPANRKYLKAILDSCSRHKTQLSKVDNFNIAYLKDANQPLTVRDSALSKRKLPLNMYRTKANLMAIDEKNFKLYINPAFNFEYGKSNINDKPLYTNTRAIEIRGLIDDKVGFYSFISENQIRAPYFEKEYYEKYSTLPGAHLVKRFKIDGFDYLTASGYITFRLLPSISAQFGQGTNFIGHGKRSLLLSDFATDYLFLKINTQVWRINYQNIYAKLIDRYGPVTNPWPSKYLVAHYLGINLIRTLNLGFYESAVFHDNKQTGRNFDLYYLNPIIFYRSVEHLLGDADKMMVGLNSSWLPYKGIKLYGQLMVNEFRINDLRAGKGNANDKFGYQLGVKYVDVAGINNVDIDIEYNRMRPYAYAHRATGDEEYPVNSYSHYNQPLAHPLGANFKEWLVTIKAQPISRLNFEINLITAIYGADSSGSNWGQNIFLDYRTYEQELGNHPGQGVHTTLNIAEFITSWHIRHNLFLDLQLKYRNLDSELNERDHEEIYIGTALRLNLERRRWEY